MQGKPVPQVPSPTKLTDTEYRVMLDVFSELPEVFHAAPVHIKAAFYNRLYDKTR